MFSAYQSNAFQSSAYQIILAGLGYSGYQTDAFQSDAYQVLVDTAVTPTPAYNGRGIERQAYVPRAYELQRLQKADEITKLKAQKEATEADLRAQEYKIEELELQRLREGLADQKLQIELLALLYEQQQMIALHKALEDRMRFIILEDDALIILLLSLPF